MSETQQDEQEQIKQRRSKLNELRENGGIAFPTDFRRNVVAGVTYLRSGHLLSWAPFVGHLAGLGHTKARLWRAGV